MRLVVLTGAGISAESGLKTFRDSDGLWNGYNIEDVATPRAWKKNKQLVLDFYNMRRQDVLNAKPNAAHFGLAELEKEFEGKIEIEKINIDENMALGQKYGVMSIPTYILVKDDKEVARKVGFTSKSDMVDLLNT